MDKDFRLLHLHAQPHEHGMAFIVGNREALEHLSQLIVAALARPDTAGAEDFMASDGEGYDVYVLRVDSPWGDETGYWHNARVPYTDTDYDRNKRDGLKWPWDLIDWESVRARKAAPRG